MAGVFIQNDGKITSAATPSQPAISSEVYNYLSMCSDIVDVKTLDYNACIACGLYADTFKVSFYFGKKSKQTKFSVEVSLLQAAVIWARSLKSVPNFLPQIVATAGTLKEGILSFADKAGNGQVICKLHI